MDHRGRTRMADENSFREYMGLPFALDRRYGRGANDPMLCVCIGTRVRVQLLC